MATFCTFLKIFRKWIVQKKKLNFFFVQSMYQCERFYTWIDKSVHHCVLLFCEVSWRLRYRPTEMCIVGTAQYSKGILGNQHYLHCTLRSARLFQSNCCIGHYVQTKTDPANVRIILFNIILTQKRKKLCTIQLLLYVYKHYFIIFFTYSENITMKWRKYVV